MEAYMDLLNALEAMGFSKALAQEALSSVSPGNTSIQAAVNWILDSKKDQTSFIPMSDSLNISIEAVGPEQISEKVKLIAQELRNGACKNKTDEEKQPERERGKIGRRGVLEPPREGSISAKPVLPMKTKYLFSEHTDWLAVSPSTKREIMTDCLRYLKHRNKEDNTKAVRAFQTLLIYLRNVANNPDDAKFRKIHMSNPAFQERIGKFVEGVKFLELCGFELVEGGKFLSLPREKIDMGLLKFAGEALHNASTNPFFGLFSNSHIDIIS